MNIKVDKKEDCTANITIEVPADVVATERAEILKSFAKNVNIKGFRKGKTPIKMIEKRHAADIKGELQNRLINQALAEAAKEKELEIINISVPEEPTFPEGGTFEFKAEATLAPTFELPTYKGLEVKTSGDEVTKEEEEASIEDLRKRFADFEDTETALEKGQFAIVNYTSNIDGKKVEEVIGKSAGFIDGRDGQWIKIEEDSFLPGFVDQITGLKKGAEKVIPIEIPAEFPIEALRGQTVNFDVTITETKKQMLPEVDEEFAKKLMGEEGTVESLKSIITEQLGADKVRSNKELKMQQIFEQLTDSSDFAVPQQSINAEKNGLLQQSIRQATEQGVDEAGLEAQRETLETQAAEQAEKNVRSTFILQKIAKEESIEVSDQDLIGRISEMADAAKKPVKAYLKEIQKANALDNVRHQILLSKAIDFVVDSAKVTIEKPKKEKTANA